jgi:hypothetical protein
MTCRMHSQKIPGVHEAPMMFAQNVGTAARMH